MKTSGDSTAADTTRTKFTRSAFAAASKHSGQPTVILAKTVKGYGMGEAGEGQNITHQQKKLGEEALISFRDRFRIPLTDEEVASAPFYRPPDDSPEIEYMLKQRKKLGGFLPKRRNVTDLGMKIPDLEIFSTQLKGNRRARDFDYDGICKDPDESDPGSEYWTEHRSDRTR